MHSIKKVVRLHCDGASKGNPGPSGIGGVISDEQGATVLEFSEAIGRATNNVAEYNALIFGLKKIQEMPGAKAVQVFSDSELMVKQLTGFYRVKDPSLLLLAQEVERIRRTFAKFELKHIGREDNKRADELASLAVKDSKKSCTDLFQLNGGL